MELVEKGKDTLVPKAKVSAVIWRNMFEGMESVFIQQTGSRISAGLAVLLNVEVSYHELYGLSLVVRDIDPTYTLGDMERARRETIENLKKEGMLDRNSELNPPVVMQRIAVVSSSKAAGYQDFINELKNNEQRYSYNITLFNAVMQGNEAENSIISALLDVADKNDEFDVVVILRGGGSQSDLVVFNSYPLCYTIASMPIKVMTGIGHDKDVSVADMVSSHSVKTPTALARYILDRTIAFDNELSEFREYLKDMIMEYTSSQKALLDNYAANIKDYTMEAFNIQDNRLSKFELYLKERSRTYISKRAMQLDVVTEDIKRTTKYVMVDNTHSLDKMYEGLKNGVYDLLYRQNNRLNEMMLQSESFNPKRILKLGYAVARQNNKALRSVKDTTEGSVLDIVLEDGVLKTRVEKISAIQ